MEGMDLLPGGLWDAVGQQHRAYELAPLTGRDEELLAKQKHRETASLVTAVLSHTVRRIGDIAPVNETVIRELAVGDRQYLMLKLSQLTFGNQVRANLSCPWQGCGKPISIAFGLDDVPIETAPEPCASHTMTLSPQACDAEAGLEIVFRLPNGADQEALSPMLATNEAQALGQLLARTVQRIGGTAPKLQQIEDLSSRARAEIEAEMERLSPKLDFNMDINCPECGRGFVAPFDLHNMFFGELRSDSDLLYRQIHYLAYHYHWSEQEIMAMTRDKRLRYVELLADEIEKLNDAG